MGAVHADGKTFNGFSVTGKITKTATVWFTPSWRIKGSSYGMKNGKHVKQAYVRIKEGSYDSGRKWTKAARSKKDKREYRKSISKKNKPFATMKANYGWRYF
ncbi:hypothetical protein JOC94_004658 [Bacillus thermophilus]|uniref:Uncharacterized protein n=1 Tax=Siminovitchia thermophila TaxID=1245522 RepID=A0ABS2RD91_9BACI|nr:hypothetical protein [Siminovitchia thermophila]MBM7717627.1 hypothetical protein [Siminovitchia thermophila]